METGYIELSLFFAAAHCEFQLTECAWLPYNKYQTSAYGEKLCPCEVLDCDYGDILHHIKTGSSAEQKLL